MIMGPHHMGLITAVIAGVITLVPFALAALAAGVGYKQVREFHAHTGDNSLLTRITAFSSFSDDKKTASDVAHKEPESVC
jgi:hypothetical protein